MATRTGEDDNVDDPANVDMEESKLSKPAASLKAKAAAVAAGPSYQRESKEKKPAARRGGVEDLLTVVQSSIDPSCSGTAR